MMKPIIIVLFIIFGSLLFVAVPAFVLKKLFDFDLIIDEDFADSL